MVEAAEARRHRWLGEAVELAAVSSEDKRMEVHDAAAAVASACHGTAPRVRLPFRGDGEQVPRRRHGKEAVGDGGDLVPNYYSTLQ